MSQDALEFFGLRPGRGVGTWSMPVEASVLSGTGALFGGAALGAAVAVVEQVAARPVVWAAIQFVRHVRPPSVLQIEGRELARGRRASQVSVVARVDGAPVFTVIATSGERDPALTTRQWATLPSVLRPDDAPPRKVLSRHRGRFMERTQARLALTEGERSAIWMRVPSLTPSGATLGIAGDYVPFALRHAVGEGWANHSLDNTLRVLRAPSDGWILADVTVEGVAGGFGHGRVHLWDEQGQLLGTASQSFTIRRRPD